MIRSYEDLFAYKNSKKLYPIIVKVCAHFSRSARYLADQICRSANAIHADIAEGYGRSAAEFKMYLTRALGSCNELKSHLEDAGAVGYLRIDTVRTLVDKYSIVSKQIYQLRERWK